MPAEDIDALVVNVRRDIGDSIPVIENYGYAGSLALCAIDSVFSLGVRYGSTRKVVAR